MTIAQRQTAPARSRSIDSEVQPALRCFPKQSTPVRRIRQHSLDPTQQRTKVQPLRRTQERPVASPQAGVERAGLDQRIEKR